MKALRAGGPPARVPHGKQSAGLFSSPPALFPKKGFRRLRATAKGAAFGNRKPFEKGLTEIFYFGRISNSLVSFSRIRTEIVSETPRIPFSASSSRKCPFPRRRTVFSPAAVAQIARYGPPT